MIRIITRYLQNKIDETKLFQNNYGLTDLVTIDDKTYPMFYIGNGKYIQKFEPNKWFGVSYFRKNGDISFSEGSFPSIKPQETPISISIPLTFIATIKKDRLKSDDNYIGDEVAFYIAKVFSDINSLKQELTAKRVTIYINNYSTDGKVIINNEFEGYDVKIKPEYLYLSMEIEVSVETTKQCMLDYCDSLIIDEISNFVIDQNNDNLKG